MTITHPHGSIEFFIVYTGCYILGSYMLNNDIWAWTNKSFQYITYLAWSRLILFFKDTAHLSTLKKFHFREILMFYCRSLFGYCQSAELISVCFCEKMTFFPNFVTYFIFAKYVSGASLGLPTACRLIAVSGARLPSVDGLVVRCIEMHHHVKSAITMCF